MKIEFTKKRTTGYGLVTPGLVMDTEVERINIKDAKAYIKMGIAKELKDGSSVHSDS